VKRRLVLYAVLAAAVLAAVWMLRLRPASTTEVRHAITAVIAQGPQGAARRDSTPAAIAWAEARRFYVGRHAAPAWCDAGGPRPLAFQAVRSLMHLGRHGLDTTSYAPAALQQALTAARVRRGEDPDLHAARLARLDVDLSLAFLRAVREIHDGRLPARALDSHWVELRDTLDAVARLAEAIHRRKVDEALDRAAPAHPAYHALMPAMERYLRIAAAGGWPAVGAGPKLERGSAGPRVAALRRRLAIEEGVAPDTTGTPFDSSLTEGVKRFQRRTGFKPTGVVDEATRKALDVKAADRVTQLEMNLERWRWMPTRFAEPYVMVNVPAFQLAVHDSGREVLAMRVVVGLRDNPTPVFGDYVTYLEFNPTWRLPKRIVAEEILPAFRRDTSYFAKNEIRVFYTRSRRPREVRPDSIDWTHLESDSFPFFVRQDPGDKNPLGRIKFMLPNEYDVYLHDTPARSFFARDLRAQSHGCVRVEKPRLLAEWFLRRIPKWTTDSLDTVLTYPILRQAKVEGRVPVHVAYWTAWADSAGAVHWREDLYGLDRRMAEAIRTGDAADFVVNPEVLWGKKKAEQQAELKRRRAAAAPGLATGPPPPAGASGLAP